MALTHLASGFLVKLIAGFDDTMTRIPIVANLTKTKKGRIIFSIGIFLAVTVSIIIAFLFGSIIKAFPYSKYISSALILIIAISIYFELLTKKEKKVLEKKVKKIKPLSVKRFFRLILIGFITGIATIIDDTIVYAGLFIGSISDSFYSIAGIFLGTMLQLTVIIYFSGQFSKIKHKKEITTIGLIILAILIFLEII